jgi:hypothetical protein
MLPDTFRVTGIVTDGEAPVEGAIVLQGGGTVQATTQADGRFDIELTLALPGTPVLVAGKEGYRSAGIEIDALPDGDIELPLFAARPPDNTAYEFGRPGTGQDGSTVFCGHCHETLAQQFQTSAHAKATRDPIVQDLYAGVASSVTTATECANIGGEFLDGTTPGSPGTPSKRCYVGAGVLPDLNPCGASAQSCDNPALPMASKPTAFGRCADCHALTINGVLAGRDLLEASGDAFEHGNHCDGCHKISDVDLTKPPGRGGRLIIQRPRERVSDEIGASLAQVMYGPHPDVVNPFMGGSYQPKFRTAVLCAGCHQYEEQALLPGQSIDATKWPTGLPIHDTYREWEDSTWNDPTTPCQSCHMPPVDGVFNSVDKSSADVAGVAGGFRRPAGSVRGHGFIGPLFGTPRLADLALSMNLTALATPQSIDVSVAIDNIGAGHAVPTGDPMRSVIVLVDGDACGTPLTPSGGMTVPTWGGAKATAVVGAPVAFAGATLSWVGHPPISVGDILRVVRPTGAFDDYIGVGRFGSMALTPAEKGMEVLSPVGAARVMAVDPNSVTLDAALVVNDGDLVLVGDAAMPSEGAKSGAYAGALGYAFGKLLVDPAGNQAVAHHRGIEIVSDNRIPPGERATTEHAFALPTGCAMVTVRATLLYRPLPFNESSLRRWDARDYVIAQKNESIAL